MAKSIKGRILNVNLILGLLISLTATYFLFPTYFDMPIYPVPPSNDFWAGLDPSWVSGVNYVNLKGLVWGKDFVFTLGPLSYLGTRVGWGQSGLDFILFDLFCSINFLIIFFKNYTRSKNKIITAIFIFAIALILPPYLGSLYSFILLSFLLFWIKESIDNKGHLPYFFQIIILVLLFYLKFNTGLISFVLFISAIAYKLIFKKGNPIFLVLYLILPGVLIYFTSIALKVSLPDYIETALSIVSGYNDVMYFSRKFCDRHVFTFICLLIPLGILAYQLFKEGKKNLFYNLFVLFLFSVSAFVLFKQAFVRADESHVREFFYCILFIVFCITDFHLNIGNKYRYGLVFVLLGISLFYTNKLDPNAFSLTQKISKKGYIEGYQNFTPLSGFRLFPNGNQFPDTIKNAIGNNAVDAYPWNTQVLLENKLNFTPRPVFQAYAAYTPELEQLNFEYYSSSKAPKFVIYDYCSIDERYPLFDESKLNLLLATNYTCRDTLAVNNRQQLLLEKTSDKKITLIPIREYAMNLGDPLKPQEGIYYKVFLYRNLLGDFVSMVNHAPEISLTIVNKDGNTKEYKTSKGLLETGIFGTQQITNVKDFKSLTAQENKDQRQIDFYYFLPKTSSLFKSKVRIIEYKINIE
jgi:hypothetical protein